MGKRAMKKPLTFYESQFWAEVGQAIATIRSRHGFSQQTLAASAGVSTSTLQHLETGKNRKGEPNSPYGVSLVNVCEALCVGLDDVAQVAKGRLRERGIQIPWDDQLARLAKEAVGVRTRRRRMSRSKSVVESAAAEFADDVERARATDPTRFLTGAVSEVVSAVGAYADALASGDVQRYRSLWAPALSPCLVTTHEVLTDLDEICARFFTESLHAPYSTFELAVEQVNPLVVVEGSATVLFVYHMRGTRRKTRQKECARAVETLGFVSDKGDWLLRCVQHSRRAEQV